MIKTWSKAIVFSAVIFIFCTAPLNAEEDSDKASFSAYDLAGDAGIIAAIGGLALNFWNTRQKFQHLEVKRLKTMQDNIDEERERLRERLEVELNQVRQENGKLHDSVLELKTQISALQTENVILKSRMNRYISDRSFDN
jgi:hypothetical protein